MNVIYTGDRADAPDIVGCVGNIISSIKGSIPYARDMGIDDSVVSSPKILSREFIWQKSKIKYPFGMKGCLWMK